MTASAREIQAVDASEQADRIAAAVSAVPGVVALHGGMFGEVGTYLPGRRVPGVRLGLGFTEIHVSISFEAPVRETANRVRAAVAAIVPGPVDVTVEDVIPLTPAVPVEWDARERQ
ncbi:hypothetical protein NVS88_03735 [Corynebacteriales bacterium D3-21]|uniref:Asp23/Gls24 family envelope stress response protein n=2 Tax=Speluncibacter jeojiensis TaxID=2710754 RepID=A0A9X4M3B9_9ACTN|nr:hypothetical protein [Corynebacteriales bacterium D3-21]